MKRGSTIGLFAQVGTWPGVAAMVVAVLSPSGARANRVNDLELSLTEDEAVIQLRAEQPLGEPRTRFDRGTVRAWFPGVGEDTRLDVPGDGSAISRVRLRPGASSTALLKVELGDRRKLRPQDVVIQTHAGGAMIRIARSVLADVAGPPGAPRARRSTEAAPRAQRSTEAAPRAQRSTEAAPSVHSKSAQRALYKGAQSSKDASSTPRTTQRGGTTSGFAASRPAPPGVAGGKAAGLKKALAMTGATAVDETEGKSESPASAVVPLSISAAAGGAAEPQEENAAGSPLAPLVGATALLALVYGLVRVLSARKGRPLAHASIEVIGSRRLGTRHQLVLVRALGEDHLLSMNGERTERIASSPSPGSQASTLRLLPPPQAAPRSLARALDEEPDKPEAPAEDGERPREAPFGAELLSFMQRRANMSARPGSQAASEGGESPAVAGLVRLRRRAAS